MADLKNELEALVVEAARELSAFLEKGEKTSGAALVKAFEAKPEVSPVEEDREEDPIGEESAAGGDAPDPALDTPDKNKLVPGGEEPVEAEVEGEMPVDGVVAESGAESEGDFLAEVAMAYSELDDDELCDHYMALKSVLYDRLKGAEHADAEQADAAVPAPEAPVAPEADKTLEMSEKTMSKAEESVSSKSMSKDESSPAGSMQSLSKDSVSPEGNGGETKKAKDPAGSGGKVAEQDPEPKHKMHKDYPVAQAKGGSEKVAPGGEGRLEAVGTKEAPPKKIRLDEVGDGVDKSEKMVELELKVEQLTKALELMVSAPQRKSVSDRWELAKSETAHAPKRPAHNLSKAELDKKLVELSKSEKLEKSERDLINNYYFRTVTAADLTDLINKYNK